MSTAAAPCLLVLEMDIQNMTLSVEVAMVNLLGLLSLVVQELAVDSWTRRNVQSEWIW